jgi:WXXGXW repeat (2 copies)
MSALHFECVCGSLPHPVGSCLLIPSRTKWISHRAFASTRVFPDVARPLRPRLSGLMSSSIMRSPSIDRWRVTKGRAARSRNVASQGHFAANAKTGESHLRRGRLPERPASCCNHLRRTNVRKLLLTALCGIAVGVGVASAAEVVIKLKPPISIHETRGPAPSPKHVWIAGYHRWDGNAYVWEKGRWDVPPREHAVWVAPKYTHRHDGYVYTEGHWR